MARLLAILAVFVLVSGTGCRQDPPADAKKAKKAEAAEAARVERAAVLRFANGLRAILEWEATQPRPRTEREQQNHFAELSSRLQEVPVKNLPKDLADPWQQFLPACQALTESPGLDPHVREQASAAAAALNRSLAARGIPEVSL